MNEKNYYIFKTLDNSPRLLYWAVDEFLIMVVPIFLGIFFGSFLLMTGSFLKVFYTRLKKAIGYGSIAQYAYWHLPTNYFQQMGHFKRLPPSYIREYIL